MTISAIKPSDIDTSQHFWNAFGNCETEISARWIVRFCQDRESWEPFTYDELNSFCEANGHKGDFWFNCLGKEVFIYKHKDDLYSITQRFICRCYEASPVLEKENENAMAN